MRKLKIALPIITFLYLFAGAFFFLSSYSADESEYPTVPTIYGLSYEQIYLDEEPYLWVNLYNPPINLAENPYVGQKICSVETSLTFPKDLLEVQSVDFTTNDANNYSNETGTINFKATLSPCTTLSSIDLFIVIFKTKQLGQGSIHFTKHLITGGADNVTVLSSAVYSDFPVDVVPAMQYDPEPIINDPLPDVPADIPQPQVQPVTKNTTKSGAKSASSSSAAAKTATKTENNTFKTPTLSKLEFSSNAVLDKVNSKSQGTVFTGTAEPNSKVNLLIHSQTEIFTDVVSGADGTWTKTIDSWLEDGGHTVTVWSENGNSISPKFTSPFVVSSYAKDQIAIGDTYPEVKVTEAVDTGLKIEKESKINTLMKNKFFWAYVGGGIVLIAIIIILIVKSRRNKNNSGNDIGSSGTGNISSLNVPTQNPTNQGSTDSIYPNTDI